MRKWILPVILLGIVCGNAYALVDVTRQVKIIRTPPAYDSDTEKTYIDVSLKNSSSEDLEFPLRLVFTSLEKGNVTIPNPDGYDENGNPYYLFFTPDQTKLAPGETVGPKRIFFNNIMLGICKKSRVDQYCSRLKGKQRNNCLKEQHNFCKKKKDPLKAGFCFAWYVQLSTTQETLNNFVSALSNQDVEKALESFDSQSQEKYRLIFNTILESLPNLAERFNNRTLIYITDVLAKYRIEVIESDGLTYYYTYLYKNSKGEWKIFIL